MSTHLSAAPDFSRRDCCALALVLGPFIADQREAWSPVPHLVATAQGSSPTGLLRRPTTPRRSESWTRRRVSSVLSGAASAALPSPGSSRPCRAGHCRHPRLTGLPFSRARLCPPLHPHHTRLSSGSWPRARRRSPVSRLALFALSHGVAHSPRRTSPPRPSRAGALRLEMSRCNAASTTDAQTTFMIIAKKQGKSRENAGS